MARIIRSTGMYKIAHLLRVNQVTLRLWHTTGFLRHNPDKRYSEFDIDRLLREGNASYAPPPRFDDLMTGRLSLIPASEAMDLLGLTDSQRLLDRLYAGGISAIKLVGEYRYSRQSIEVVLGRRSQPRLTRRMAAHVLGVEVATIGRLVKAGKLQDASVVGDGSSFPVSQSSLLELLQGLLPSWIGASDWLIDRLDSGQPLVTFDHAAQVIGVSPATLGQILDQERCILHIRLPGNPAVRRVSIDSLAAYVEREPPVSLQDIARQFGVSPDYARAWTASGWMGCPVPLHLHDMQDGALRRACLVAVLRGCLSPGLSAITWYHERLAHDSPLVGLDAAAKKLRISPPQLMALAQDGVVRGIRTPAGAWMFSSGQLTRQHRRQQSE